MRHWYLSIGAIFGSVVLASAQPMPAEAPSVVPQHLLEELPPPVAKPRLSEGSPTATDTRAVKVLKLEAVEPAIQQAGFFVAPAIEVKLPSPVSAPINGLPGQDYQMRSYGERGLPVAPLFPRLHRTPNPCPPATPFPPLTPSNPNTPPTQLPSPEEIARNVPNSSESFASQTEGGGTAPRSFNDNFNGDFGGITVRVRRQVGTFSSTQTLTQDRQQTGVSGPFGPITTETFTNPTTSGTTYQDFFVSGGARYGGILITENDSPRPTSRVYFGGNYYNGINESLNSAPVNVNGTTLATVPLANSTDTVGGLDYVLTNRSTSTASTSQQFVPNLSKVSMVRETVGFEYAFWNDSASFGMRLPYQQTLAAPSGLGGHYLGDLSLLFKHAFYDNRRTGDLLSVGLVVSTPIGNDPKIVLADGSYLPVSVLYQPWLGGIKMFQRGYIQGITSLLIPTNNSEPTLVNNSIAASYFLYQNNTARFLKMVAPAIEVHVRTPLDNRDPNGVIYVQDQVNTTGSIHFRSDRITVSPAFSIPLLGNKPWNYEAMLWVNVRF